MALKEIIDEYENTLEPRLEEIRTFFERNESKEMNRTTIQRCFNMGYRQASRALRQLK